MLEVFAWERRCSNLWIMFHSCISFVTFQFRKSIAIICLQGDLKFVFFVRWKFFSGTISFCHCGRKINIQNNYVLPHDIQYLYDNVGLTQLAHSISNTEWLQTSNFKLSTWLFGSKHAGWKLYPILTVSPAQDSKRQHDNQILNFYRSRRIINIYLAKS